MIEINTKLRKWGNSFGIIVPQKAIQETNAKEGDEVTVLFKKDKVNVLKETFGTLKTKKPTAEIMKEIDEALDSEI